MKQIEFRVLFCSSHDPLSRLLAFCTLFDRLLFHHIPNPNTFMCNTIVFSSFFLHANVPSIAFSSFFLHMLRRQQMDCRTFVFIFKACHMFRGLCQGESVHCVVLKMGFDSELLVRNGLIHLYAAYHGSFDGAHKVFDECSEKDVFTIAFSPHFLLTTNYSLY